MKYNLDEFELELYTSQDLVDVSGKFKEWVGPSFSQIDLRMGVGLDWVVTIYAFKAGENRNILRGFGDDPMAALNNLALRMQVMEAEGDDWWKLDELV